MIKEKNKIIYIHGEGIKSVKSVNLDEVKTRTDLISKFTDISDTDFRNSKKEIEIFLDNDQEKGENENFIDAISDKDHIHCHRCKKIKAIIVYNDNYEIELPPNVKLEVVYKKAVNHFKLGPKDAADLVLRLTKQGEILQDYDRLGSFAHFPNCEVKLFLTPKKNIQG